MNNYKEIIEIILIVFIIGVSVRLIFSALAKNKKSKKQKRYLIAYKLALIYWTVSSCYEYEDEEDKQSLYVVLNCIKDIAQTIGGHRMVNIEVPEIVEYFESQIEVEENE